MNWANRRLFLLLIMALPLATTLSGCGKAGQKPQPAIEPHIQKAARLYMEYMKTHNNKPPSSEAELAQFIKNMKKADLDAFGVEDPEKVLISPRDNEPYGVVTKVQAMRTPSNKPGMKPGNETFRPPIILYEKTGSGGKHYCAFQMGGGFTEVTSEELKNMIP